jgi:hypothetical protein
MSQDDIPSSLETEIVRSVLAILYRSRPARIALSAYTILSIISLAVGGLWGSEGHIFELNFLWVFGPPVNLLHGAPYSWVFLMGTLVCGACALAAYRSRRWWTKGIIALGGIVAWFTVGALVYAPMT